MKSYIFLFSMGFVGVTILNSAITIASRSMGHRLAYTFGTLAGALVGMTLGARFK